mmetsp:Transcript_18755/g.23267  ORF Transcript_18755/g.23267 Transcript_18755/m.23267 type:complete len:123 (-) Transcript_18755:843-1211(-)
MKLFRNQRASKPSRPTRNLTKPFIHYNKTANNHIKANDIGQATIRHKQQPPRRKRSVVENISNFQHRLSHKWVQMVRTTATTRPSSTEDQKEKIVTITPPPPPPPHQQNIKKNKANTSVTTT